MYIYIYIYIYIVVIYIYTCNSLSILTSIFQLNTLRVLLLR